ncbi:MAG: helix-turn-helix domain-containing protein [Clostridia bacterium]|nr:helix-turn-helix domain-containing protein [Clostridia bacterium]
MEYKFKENTFPVYFSTMSGITNAPYSMLYGSPVKSAPLERLHYHSVPEIGICVAGEGDYYIGDKVYRFKKGDLQIIRPFVPHNAVSDVNTYTQIVFFTFDTIKLMHQIGIYDPEITMLMKNIQIPFNGIYSPDEYPEITTITKKIIERCETSDDFTDISVALSIGEFMLTCRKYNEKHKALPAEKLIEKGYSRIAPAIQRINTSIDDSSAIAEEELARICGMSVSNFRRIFKLETGLSPKAFIIKSRMSYATYLLKNTNMTVIKIAEKVGYTEVCGFNKIFLSTFKMSPSQYRKQYK